MTEIEQTIQNNKKKLTKLVAKWVENESNKQILLDEELSDIIYPFVKSGGTQFKKNVPRSLQNISVYYQMQFMNASLQGNVFDKALIGKSALYKYWHYQTLMALMTSNDPGGRDSYSKSSIEFADILLYLALDWHKEARSTAATLLDYWDAGFRDGQIPFEVIPDYPGWFAIKLARQWLGPDVVDERYEFEPKDKELKALDGVFQNWRNPDVAIFQNALDEAASFHVLESGENGTSGTGDERYAIPDDFHWFFPVELLAACRLREYEGLVMPKFTHPLFEATAMGPLQTKTAVPKDEMLDQLLPVFAKATGNLEL